MLVHIYYCLSCVRHRARAAAGAKMTIKTLSLMSVAYRGMEIVSQTSACIYKYIYIYICLSEIAVNNVGHCDFSYRQKQMNYLFMPADLSLPSPL